MAYIASIVEGHGEVEAVPTLLHRLAGEHGSMLKVNPPIRVKAGSYINDGQYFLRHTELVCAKAASNNGMALILLDCEDHCPAELGPKLLAQAKAVRNDVPIVVALAFREFETWFIAGAHSLRGVAGLPSDLTAPPDFERIRDAKGWLRGYMPSGYDPIQHQRLLVSRLDFQEARKASTSFRRLSERLAPIFVTES